jgi:HD-GYP domain-containing protein (c-di-GMP phosphodiesterase class II)
VQVVLTDGLTCFQFDTVFERQGVYTDQLTEEFVSNVSHSAPLHDIGKIHVPDAILNKPGRLTAEEFEIMKSHTTAGYEILEQAVKAVSEPTYLDEAKNLAEYQHEKWAGGGYPTGISGEDIPLSARIMAVADVFDALVSKRSYKDGFPLEKAYAIIEEGAGTHFDPLIAYAVLDARDDAAAIATEYGDGQTDKIPWVPTGTAAPPPQTSAF